MKDISHLIDTYRGKLISYAYSVLGDVLAAEDVVHEVLNKYIIELDLPAVNEQNYLIKAVVNKSINEKQRLRSRKEEYRGHWLPSPVISEKEVYKQLDSPQWLNYSLLVLLEQLNPSERAVFILKESFDYSHAEIAEVIGIEIDNSRQLLKRARKKLGRPRSFNLALKSVDAVVLENLTEAITSADMEKVKGLLTDEIQCVSDGGNKVSASRNILRGKERVSKILKAIYGKYMPDKATARFVYINQQPALLYLLQGVVFRCMIFEMSNEHIDRIFVVVNPDKLIYLNK